MASLLKEEVLIQIQKMEPGHVFVIEDLNYACSKSNIYRILRALKKEKTIGVAYRNIYYKTEYSEILGGVPLPPDIMDLVEKIVEKNQEVIQLHGAHVANRFRISTQMPLTKVFLTSGYSREVNICGSRVKFIHTNNKRLLQYSMHAIGSAISCMYYLRKAEVDDAVLEKIRLHIGDKNFSLLKDAEIELWMKKSISEYLSSL